MKNILGLCCLVCLWAMACTSESTTETATDKTTTETTMETPETTEKLPSNESEETANPYKRQLIGEWQSTEDANDWLKFTKDQCFDYYIGDADLSVNQYILDYNCDGTAPAPTDGEAPAYIRLTDDDMCWYIIKVDEENLELSYVGRGNTLTYKRGTLSKKLAQ